MLVTACPKGIFFAPCATNLCTRNGVLYCKGFLGIFSGKYFPIVDSINVRPFLKGIFCLMCQAMKSSVMYTGT